MYEILVCILGKSKSELDDTMQIQFSCPNCQERDGEDEKRKFHLEVNLIHGVYKCWKCSSIDDSMHGSIYKLIRKYGNETLYREYKEAVVSFRDSSLYKLNFTGNDFALDPYETPEEELEFPKGYVKFQKGANDNTKAFQYLSQRGIDWPIIEDYHIGFTGYQESNKKGSNRIILPSFDRFGKLNYWTGRDYTGNGKRQRYDNPKADRKTIIFNEEKIQWNADVTLVEGPFDSIVVPNSIPLLGKNLNEGYYLYQALSERCNANISIMLDGDALSTAVAIYRLLDRGRLKGHIRLIHIPSDENELDPSKIFQLWGRRGIIKYLNSGNKLQDKGLYY